MKKHIAIINTTIKLPVISTVLYTFLLHYFNVSGLVWGIFITLYSILWIVVIIMKWNEVQIDLTKDEFTKEQKTLLTEIKNRLNKTFAH